MNRTRNLALLLCLAVVTLVLGGCGDSSTGVGSPGSPDDVVSSTPDPNATDQPGGGAQIVTPQPGQADVRAIPFQKAKVIEGGTSVKLLWYSGVEPCNVLDSIQVDYSPDAVTITLFEGHTPSDEDVACIELAVKKATIVELSEPLGGREILDGAK